ncbi:DUF6950 family protein [Pseudidiomarina aestuarii]|uniref:DUF6950 family protein n=1 Tax=Pseudidiomarina aestuarii TaxID=624146 RepID=UPI003A96A19E
MRVKDWPTRLIQLLQQRRTMPFEWGVNDCCLFAADAIEAVTGEDPAPEFRDRYSTELGSMRVLKREGYESIEAVLRAKLGEPNPRQAPARGDIVLVDYMGTLTVGVYFNCAWVLSEDGLVQAPAKWIIRTWSIN